MFLVLLISYDSNELVLLGCDRSRMSLTTRGACFTPRSHMACDFLCPLEVFR